MRPDHVLSMPAAAAIALGYGLATLAAFCRDVLRRPWLLGAFAAGALVFPLTLALGASVQALANAVFGWGPDAVATTLGAGLLGGVITATVNETFKLVAALGVRSWSRRRGAAVTFGAAAGAGFAAVGAYKVIQLALMALALPISSPSSFIISLAQQMAWVVVNAASTALAADGMAGGGASEGQGGVYVAIAILCEATFAAFGLLYELRAYSTTVWTVLAVATAAALFAGVLMLDRRRSSDAALAPTV